MQEPETIPLSLYYIKSHYKKSLWQGTKLELKVILSPLTQPM